MAANFEDLKRHSICRFSWSKKACGGGWGGGREEGRGEELAEWPLRGLGSGNGSFMEVKIAFMVKYTTPKKESIGGVPTTCRKK